MYSRDLFFLFPFFSYKKEETSFIRAGAMPKDCTTAASRSLSLSLCTRVCVLGL